VKKKIIRLFMILGLILSFSIPAFAYYTYGYEMIGGPEGRWTIFNPNNWGNGSEIPYVTICGDAVNSWNTASSKVDFDYVAFEDWTEGYVEVIYIVGDYGWNDWHAATFIYNAADQIIPLPVDEDWKYAFIKLNQVYLGPIIERYLIQSTCGHELGHAMGLDENWDDVELLMYPENDRYDDEGVYTPQQDDINGINAIY